MVLTIFHSFSLFMPKSELLPSLFDLYKRATVSNLFPSLFHSQKISVSLEKPKSKFPTLYKPRHIPLKFLIACWLWKWSIGKVGRRCKDSTLQSGVIDTYFMYTNCTRVKSSITNKFVLLCCSTLSTVPN